MARQYYKDSTTGQMKPLGVKVEDTLPVGTIVEYNGQDIPEGWVDIGNGKIEKQYQVIPTNAKLENGDSTSATNGYTAEYINDHSVVVSPTEPTGSARKKIWKQHSGNLLRLFNSFGTSVGISITNNHDGSITLHGTATQDAFIQIGYITIKANTNYILTGTPEGSSSTTYFQYFDNANLSGNRQDYGEGAVISYSSEVAIPITVCVRLGKNVEGKKFYPMINEGTEALPFEMYAEDKEYILNDDIYEKFTPLNNIYSSEETRIGTWITGQPLYRKVISLGKANSVSSPVSLNEPTSKQVRRVEYSIYNNNNFINIPANCYDKIDDVYSYAQLGVQNNSYVVYFKTNRTLSDYYILEVTIEYTKNTE